jgi:putative ABC transport system substrate-binding protein
MKRRVFLTASAAAFGPAASRAQGKTFRVGLLASNTTVPGGVDVFREALKQRGYVEGSNLVLDVRWPKSSMDEVQDIAIDLVRAGPDVIASWTTPPTLAVRNATSNIPIVMMSIGDPVGAGLVASLARPGGNVTGVSNQDAEVVAKAVELFREVIPGLRRMGVIYNAGNPSAAIQMRALEDTARRLAFDAQVSEATTVTEYEIAFARFLDGGVQGAFFVPDASTGEHRKVIADWAIARRVPTMFQRRLNVDAGGLMSYGADLIGQFRQAASYVDRILKGAKPAELPVVQPEKFELVINRKTAKAIGVAIPPALLARAEEVID